MLFAAWQKRQGPGIPESLGLVVCTAVLARRRWVERRRQVRQTQDLAVRSSSSKRLTLGNRSRSTSSSVLAEFPS
jgi:hypothetical protein